MALLAKRGARWSCLLTQEWNSTADVWDDFLLVCQVYDRVGQLREISDLLLQCKR